MHACAGESDELLSSWMPRIEYLGYKSLAELRLIFMYVCTFKILWYEAIKDQSVLVPGMGIMAQLSTKTSEKPLCQE